MNTKHQVTVLFGVVAVILVHQHRKLNRTINCLDRMCDVISEHLENDYQQTVDTMFNIIVDNNE